MSAAPVFADVDTGVDDAIALIYLLASADTELIGVASTGGNVAVQQVCVNNLDLLDLCRAGDVPVAKGAEQPLSAPMCPPGKVHGPKGMGYAELPHSDRRLVDYDAASAWVRAAHAYPGQLIGVATGPLTNLALALRAEPELPTLLRRLAIMGGAYDYRGNTNPVAEWNIMVDPEAAAEVFAAWASPKVAQPQELPILCGVDLTRHVVMTPDILAKLATAADSTTTVMNADDEPGMRSTASNVLIRVIEDAMRFYFESHYNVGHGYVAHLHDPLAAAVALDPALVSTRQATVDVELAGTLTRGMTVMNADDEPGMRSTASNVLIRVIEDAMRFYFESHHNVGHGYVAHLHDPLAAAVALDPALVSTRQATVDVELAGTLTRGMTVTDWSGRWSRKPNARIGVGVHPAAFFERFVERVGPFARRLG